ncbi:nucleotide exchange factor GrpE [Alicyclobacillus mengziensis]|nr:nucleotide exchange factor GrpE [Alicyclobacillus mengziensis]
MARRKNGTESQTGIVEEEESTASQMGGATDDPDTDARNSAERPSAQHDAFEADFAEDSTDANDETSSSQQSSAPEQTQREAKLAEQLQDTEAKLLRTLADFDNFRRRTRQEHEDLQKFAARKVLEGLLPVVDNFERALAAFENKDAGEDLKTGIEMVYRQLQSVLSAQGVCVMEAVGQPFDPQVHEAVMQESVDGQAAGVVLQELQKGYMLHDKVLRPAMVKVSV